MVSFLRTLRFPPGRKGVRRRLGQEISPRYRISVLSGRLAITVSGIPLFGRELKVTGETPVTMQNFSQILKSHHQYINSGFLHLKSPGTMNVAPVTGPPRSGEMKKSMPAMPWRGHVAGVDRNGMLFLLFR